MPPKSNNDTSTHLEINPNVRGHSQPHANLLTEEIGWITPLQNNVDLISSMALLELEKPFPTHVQTEKNILGVVEIIHHKIQFDENNISIRRNQHPPSPSCREEQKDEGAITETFTFERRVKDEKCICNDKHQSTRKKEKKRVHFQSLHTRTYNTVVGDHPCCTSGLPITFGWDYSDQTTITIDEYETTRQPMKHRRDLKLDCDSRRQILSGTCKQTIEGKVRLCSEGYSELELNRAGRKLYRERQRRVGRSQSSMKMTDRFFMTP